ncbi:cation:proton antiporter [Nocardia sp. NPDC048505]|uniref:cation:proton antiporter n=1 Tax=unclassified Nocardia TaxID=2637762 RepID=UPI00340C9B76
MFVAITATMLVILGWACVSGTLWRWSVTAPLAMVVVGVLVGWASDDWLATAINTTAAQRVVEFLLALFLFNDATEIRDRIARGTGVTRLLLVAFPLSVVAATALAGVLWPGMSWAVWLLLACIVVPIDLVPAQTVLRDPRVSERVRHTINVESGFNDGLVAPVFGFALAAATASTHAGAALADALPAMLYAVLLGVPVGAVAGLGMSRAAGRGWTDPRAMRIGTLAIPVLAYSATVAIGGNGFVAAFLAGLAYRATHGEIEGEPLELTEDLAQFCSLGLWFAVGNIAVGVPWLDWRVLVYGLLALTVVRTVPVAISMLGSRFSWRERLLLGWLGPRGVASIVFGLLAINGLTGEGDIELAVGVTVVVVTGSVVLHGLGAPFLADRYGTRHA